jgi:hypothetical protein
MDEIQYESARNIMRGISQLEFEKEMIYGNKDFPHMRERKVHFIRVQYDNGQSADIPLENIKRLRFMTEKEYDKKIKTLKDQFAML